MKILITGATGFVGSHLIDLLDLQGHQIYSLYRNKNKFEKFKIKGMPIKGDFSNFNWVSSLPPDLDAVIHTAGLVHAPDIKDFYNVNTKATANLINALAKKYPKLIFGLISSQAAAGPCIKINPINELSEKNPVSHYGKSKLEAEKTLKAIKPIGWKSFIIRPPMVIGPRDPAMLEIFQIVKSGIVPVVGKSKEKNYSFVSVFDLISGINQALINIDLANGKIYFIAYPTSINFWELTQTVKQVINKKSVFYLKIPATFLKLVAGIMMIIHYIFPRFNPRITTDKVHEIIPNNWVVTSQKSQKELGVKYYWELKKIIKATYEDYKLRGWF